MVCIRCPLNRVSFSSLVEKSVKKGAAVTPTPPNDPLTLPLANFNKDFNINTVSAFVAAQQAAAGFAQLPDSAAKTFIYTGNILNTGIIIPPLLDLGVGKAATAHIIQSAAAAYKDRGYKYVEIFDLCQCVVSD